MFSPLRAVVSSTQDRFAVLLGCAVDRRDAIVAAMLQRGPSEVTAYWTQLVISAGIATLGLVLGSTAVIIGAMLVAPLMGPIVGLGMGLATGSPVLVLRAASRVVVSVTTVVTVSAMLVRFIPFHQVNTEIAARTTPTALDLGTAVFCAMAGVFAALRPSSDVATTAAGTSIGISLVPPLCVCGYGLGTDAMTMAYGAGLLFLTNFSAIVFIASLGFAGAGFGKTNVMGIESADLDRTPHALLSRAPVRRAMGALRSLGGPFLRLAMPVLLLAALFSPLRRGLDEVAWQISARDDVTAAIAAVPQRVVQSTVVVERRQVRVVIFMLGSHAEATAARERLSASIAVATGVVPSVEVHAVPDATDFEALERATRVPDAPPPAQTASPEPEPKPEPEPEELLEAGMTALARTIERRWPATAGVLLRIEVGAEAPPRRVHLVHAGAPLAEAARALLQDVVGEEFGADLELTSEDLPTEPVELRPTDAAILGWVAGRVETSRRIAASRACVTEPKRSPGARESPELAAFRLALEAIWLRHPRVERVEGPAPTLRFAKECSPAPSAR